jgi:dipeptidyl aminopeptidase/acylaminoacyl peptidase
MPPQDAAASRSQRVIAVQGFLERSGTGHQVVGPHLFLVDLRTGAVRPRRLRRTVVPFAPSPRDRRVAYQRDGGDLVVAPGLDSRPTRLVSKDARSPAWSPDGRRLAYVKGGALMVTGSGLRSARRLARRRSNTSLEGGGNGRLAWSPDGREIAFLRALPKPAGCLEAAGLDVVSVRGGAVRPMYHVVDSCNSVDGVAWSPNGRRLVLGVGSGLVTISPSGGSVRRLVSGPAFEPLWFPDGRSVAYFAYGDDALGESFKELRSVRVDGSRRRTLARLPDRLVLPGLNWWSR